MMVPISFITIKKSCDESNKLNQIRKVKMENKLCSPIFPVTFTTER